MTRFWVATDSTIEVEASDVQEHEDKLIFYDDENKEIAIFPIELVLDYGVVGHE